jgi:hypothetical protein
LQIIDSALVSACELDPWSVAESVELHAGHPFFDVEVIRAPWVDLPAASTGTDDARLRARLVQRIETLREHFDVTGDLLLSYQNPEYAYDGAEAGSPIDPVAWSRALTEAAARHAGGRWLSVAESACLTSDRTQEAIPARPHDPAAILRLHDADGRDALLAIIGLDPAMPDVRRGGADCQVTRLVRALAGGPGRTRPVHLICVTPNDLLGGGRGAQHLRRFLHRLRASLVVHGGAETSELAQVSATDLREEAPVLRQVSLVSCPTFKAGEGVPGMARLRLDIAGGAINIAFRHDLGPDCEVRPIQLLQPLQSVSRVTSAEHGLYVKVTRRLSAAGEDSATERGTRERILALRDHVEQVWDSDGYVALCEPSRAFPEIPPDRGSEYWLLVLLRERPDEDGYDLLLSNHTPLSKPMVARWDTLLLPAFKKPTELLARLRDDVIRQAVTHTEDLQRSERARSFETAVAELLKDEGEIANEVDRVSESPFTTVKFSPTDGGVTEYRYTFATLPWLVKRPLADDRRRPLQGAKIVDWLNGLPALRPDGGGGISMETLRRGGSGVRWEPDSGLAWRADSRQRRRATPLPRGVVWFPFDDAGRLWRECPSIVARNFDVMLMLEQRLAEMREDGRYPSDVVLAVDR